MYSKAVVLCLTVITVKYAAMIKCLTYKIAVTHVVVMCFMIHLPKPAAMDEYAKCVKERIDWTYTYIIISY